MSDFLDLRDAAYGQGRRMLTVEQVCQWFQIPEATLRNLVRRRAIPYRKIGTTLRFPEAELEEWSRPVDPKAGREVVLDRQQFPQRGPRRRRSPGQGSLTGVTYD